MQTFLTKNDMSRKISQALKSYFIKWNGLTFLCIACLMLLPNMSYAQDNFKLAAEKDGVKVFVKSIVCSETEVYLLKFENTTSETKIIEWDEMVSLKGQDVLQRVTPSPYKKSLELKQGITQATDCDDVPSPFLLSYPAGILTPDQAAIIKEFMIKDLSINNKSN